MTVAHVRERPGVDYVEVIFLESARFYRLLRANPSFGNAQALLRRAAAEGRRLEVLFPSLESDVVEDVRDPAGGSGR